MWQIFMPEGAFHGFKSIYSKGTVSNISDGLSVLIELSVGITPIKVHLRFVDLLISEC
ncbi:MAG: hypothetical protein RL420_493 [Pseudomonadota bacterium]|jgi:hypothetical protein